MDSANPLPLGLELNLGHLGAYFVLTAAGLRAFSGRAGERWVAPCMLLLGSALEASQALLPQRTASAADALFNAIGIGLAVVLHSLIDRWRAA